MPDYDRPHIDISSLHEVYPFKRHSTPSGRTYLRSREEHGQRLSLGLAASLEAADARRPPPELRPEGVAVGEGAFVTVSVDPAEKTLELGKPDKGVRQSAELVRDESGRSHTVVLHLRDEDARSFLTERVERYHIGELTKAGNPPLAGEIGPIDGFAPASLEDLWREDPATLAGRETEACWWGLWCWQDFVTDVVAVASALGMQVAPEDRWSTFPDVKVVPVHGRREALEAILNLGVLGLAEIGHASDDPAILVDLPRRDQDRLAEDLAERVDWPGSEVPAVCILDTGVTRGHPLIEPALWEADTQAVDPDWSVDDHETPGHGTAMAGLALHGDLTAILADTAHRHLRHRLESVKILPPPGKPMTEVANYGAITQQAVAIAEQRNPDRPRVICSAVTNRKTLGDRPTRWSASIDALAAGTDAGDEEIPPRRLFIQSIGNIPHSSEWSAIADPNQHPGEDPAQAWNALTVGGVTLKDGIDPRDASEWSPCAAVGEPSPYGRTSSLWPDGTSPVKPEVVFEAGNRAKNAAGDQVSDAMPSLSLISTGKGGAGDTLQPFYATSAAAAQASRMAAQIMSQRNEYWPETVRALIVHSAQWTPPMLAEIDTAPGMSGRKALRRRFGYGMPNLARALASAENDLALVAQAEIQPFDRPGRTREGKPNGRVTYGEAHYYDLPWPGDLLEQLENCEVRLKVTLSYFVEPYPLSGAMLDPARYRSAGLRFDLRRKRETDRQFFRRQNAEFGDRVSGSETDEGWHFGPQATSAGSLHSDLWTGTAVELASRDKLAVFPVMGWWRDRPSQQRYFDRMRYALVVTLEAPEAKVDLHAHVALTAEAMIAAKAGISFEIPNVVL